MSNVIINRINKQSVLSFYKKIPLLLRETAEYYPNFAWWLSHKVVPQFFNNKRHIFVAYDKKEPVGFSICKTTSTESKLCTLWVKKDYRHNKIGNYLLHHSLYIMKRYSSLTPILTVPEFQVQTFMPFINSGLMQNRQNLVNYLSKSKAYDLSISRAFSL